MGIGVDIDDIGRFELSKKDKLISRVFTRKEIQYCYGKAYPAQHLAVRFAGKEAIIKALTSLNLKVPAYSEIEILNDSHGVPAAKISKSYKRTPDITISLSHAKDNAIAFALVLV